MAHLTEGTLRRMVDDPDARSGADAAHLEGCAECGARLKDISDDARSIASLLAVPDATVDVGRAFERVVSDRKSQPALVRFPISGSSGRPFRLAFVAAIAAVALVVVAFTFNGFFFKPTTVKTVPVTVADMQALSQLGEYGTMTWTKQPQFQVATNAADASVIAGGLKAPVVATLPAGVSTTVTYGAMSEAEATFTFSADKAKAAAASHGKTLPALPKGMDGATLTITVGPAIGEIYGNLQQGSAGSSSLNLPQLIVARSTAPTAKSTQVTVAQLEAYILDQPGISPELKKAIKAMGDPSTTLLIPIPVEYATSKDVTVQNVPGVALGDNTGVGSGVVWVKGGSVYVVAGSIKQNVAIDIANNLK
ncbi:MAG: hypothetical protein E6J20_10880 [Chloroflexi bacterium]|nr:MAG: hypothetical protein E6J20_10880 [Chloroflexota bacterium]